LPYLFTIAESLSDGNGVVYTYERTYAKYTANVQYASVAGGMIGHHSLPVQRAESYRL